MSPTARALHERFEEVCRTELHRLRRKTASLPPAARAEVDAISVEVTRAIAARFEAALDHDDCGDLDRVVSRLFAVGAQVERPRAASESHTNNGLKSLVEGFS